MALVAVAALGWHASPVACISGVVGFGSSHPGSRLGAVRIGAAAAPAPTIESRVHRVAMSMTDRPGSNPGHGEEATTTASSGRLVLGLSLPQVAGSSLAAGTAALAGSFLGVQGTLVGAVVGSVVATVGTAVYAQSLDRAAVQLRVVRTVGQAQELTRLMRSPSCWRRHRRWRRNRVGEAGFAWRPQWRWGSWLLWPGSPRSS